MPVVRAAQVVRDTFDRERSPRNFLVLVFWTKQQFCIVCKTRACHREEEGFACPQRGIDYFDFSAANSAFPAAD